MASHPESLSMALFCDFENVALGVRDAQYEKFDIKPVLERLLLKGSIVVKKAYCDWDRYKGFKAAMHEANFELIEIPHVRQSGKNSADIRLVVDALDLCYTKSHVDTFVIISGDSDFSPLVSKLRENAKQVIGVGIKQSTSDLLIANCDEFIFYDDLVREHQRAAARREPRTGQPAARRTAEEDKPRKDDLEARRTKAIELAVATFDALVSERGDSGKMWASVLKEAIKRRRPDFNESYFGFKAFGNLLEAAQQRGLIQVGRDEKSGTYVYRSLADEENEVSYALPTPSPGVLEESAQESSVRADAGSAGASASDSRRRGRGGRGGREQARQDTAAGASVTAQRQPASTETAMAEEPEAREVPSLEAGLATDYDTDWAGSQEVDATASPGSLTTGATSPAPVPATDASPRESAARKRPRRGRQDRSTRDEAAQAEPATQSATTESAEMQAAAQNEKANATVRNAQAPSAAAKAPQAAEASPQVPQRAARNAEAGLNADAARGAETADAADRQQGGAREEGEDASARQEGKARARKTRSESTRTAKKAAAKAAAANAVTEPSAAGSLASPDTTEAAGQPAGKAARKRSGARAAKKTATVGKSEKSGGSDGE